MHSFSPKQAFDGLRYPGSLTRHNCFNFIGDEIRINVKKDFIEMIYLLIRACFLSRCFGHGSNSMLFLMSAKSALS